jgi:hypothetical protein
MADIKQITLLHDRRGWSVKVSLVRGGARRYRYGSEAQARYFAAVFALGPRTLPAALRPKARRGKKVTVAVAAQAAG